MTDASPVRPRPAAGSALRPRHRDRSVVLIMIVLIMVLVGCTPEVQPPEQTPGTPGAPSSSPSSSPTPVDPRVKACLVAGPGSLTDLTLNQVAVAGLNRAREDLGVETEQRSVSEAAQYAGAIQAMIDNECTMIISVGYALSDATLAAAQAHPELDFVIVEHEDPVTFPAVRNLKPVVFDRAQASFLAGYLAAATTRTRTVATYGANRFPSVIEAMDGFALGVAHHNAVHGGSVQVLGWSPKTRTGQFLGGDIPFDDTERAQRMTEDLIAADADVIYPVAGRSALGTLTAIDATGEPIRAIWADSNGCETVPNHCGALLTSVERNADTVLYAIIEQATTGDRPDNTTVVGTLGNGGTSLAELPESADEVPAAVRAEVAQLRQELIAGKVRATPRPSP
ncbi:BMP family lipoprotein [Propionibacteriaceae bacterium Y2011]